MRGIAFPREHRAVHGLRPAMAADAESIAHIWHAAWHDAHDAHVPAALVADRSPAYFRGRVPDLIGRTTVASDAEGVVGFVTVTDVRVTGDTQQATIFYTVLGEDAEAKDLVSPAALLAEAAVRMAIGNGPDRP